MVAKLIKTEEDYKQALDRIHGLMDAKAGTAEADELELIAKLVSDYEEEEFPIGLPDPIEAIKFRMEQAGLKQKDLVPYIGSRSKVSEVLRWKRPLSLTMMRSLHEGLGIPAEVLLQEEGVSLPDEVPGLDWAKFPLRDMLKLGWFPDFKGTPARARDAAEKLMRPLLDHMVSQGLQAILQRQSPRLGPKCDPYALLAWRARVVYLASAQSPAENVRRRVDRDFIRRLVALSPSPDGPRWAKEYLSDYGIHLVVVQHLPRTYLDGAATVLASGNPLVALTLRHDRLDNFWFSLCHELAHVALHLDRSGDFFLDDLEQKGDAVEDEADKFAAEALIPLGVWRKAPARSTADPKDVRRLANRLGVHPAIVAGRIRWERNDYTLLRPLVGSRQVRKHFAPDLHG